MSDLIAGVHHINLTIDNRPEAPAQAKNFYGELLGLKEIPRLENDQPNRPGGLWFQCGAQQLHLSAESDAAIHNGNSRRHAGFEVKDLDLMRARLEIAGIKVQAGSKIAGQKRFFTRDPFGNRLEFVELER